MSENVIDNEIIKADVNNDAKNGTKECAKNKIYYGVFRMKPKDINVMIKRPDTPIAYLFNESF